MAIIDRSLSTGLPGLDRVIAGLIPGDNIVWQVENWEVYARLAVPYIENASRTGRHIVYFRFASHPPLVEDSPKVRLKKLDPGAGFEEFLMSIHQVIEEEGRGSFYLFDCLSDLAGAWFSDQMLGNFFMLTCPYLYDFETIAYFGLYYGEHSFYATHPIEETTQLLLNVYEHDGDVYVHPLKVQQRHSDTMYLIHAWRGADFVPVTDSQTNARILGGRDWASMRSTGRQLGLWADAFSRAEQALQKDKEANNESLKEELLWMAISRDERVLNLIRRFFSLEDILSIGKRMIGTGLIGGKSVGMLLARAILKKEDSRWAARLEAHDSFYVGSDVFYTFLVENGCWFDHQHVRKTQGGDFRHVVRARQRVLRGRFPEHIVSRLAEMLEYFGQSPIIVRSSSLLEDNFGNAFAGKYESVFCPNQGPRERCLSDLLSAIRIIYASTLSDKALSYRSERGLLDRDEQMSLLVQRVSGDLYGSDFFPLSAGVGFSFNPYAWDESIDPEAGMIRLVFGLGTRAVDRSDDDYTRLVSLSAPERRPDADVDSMGEFTQRKVDVLDLAANQQVSKRFDALRQAHPGLCLDLVASRDSRAEREARKQGLADGEAWLLTFNGLLEKTSFVSDMREMLGVLERTYAFPVDVEFTVNGSTGPGDEADYQINVVQCRPLQLRGAGTVAPPSPDVEEDKVILEAHGAVIGQSRLVRLGFIVYVWPEVYSRLPMSDRYGVARCIGRVLAAGRRAGLSEGFLIGPGRWGTGSPDLGVPVSFQEISRAAGICEMVQMREGLVPDVSLGSHFFSDLVEMEMLYAGMFPEREGNRVHEEWLLGHRNALADFSPEDAELGKVLRVIVADEEEGGIGLYADALAQRVLCYLLEDA